jgi:hypothetical protein
MTHLYGKRDKRVFRMVVPFLFYRDPFEYFKADDIQKTGNRKKYDMKQIKGYNGKPGKSEGMKNGDIFGGHFPEKKD